MTPAENEILQEHIVRATLRKLAWVVGLVALLVLMLSFTQIDVKTSGDDTLSVPMLSWLERGWLVLALGPVAWVYRAPRRHPVLVAGGWFAMTWLVLQLFTGTTGWATSWAVPALTMTLTSCIAAIVMIVMPVIRLRHREQAELIPTARVHDDD